ncbi:hypothetical protein X880_6107 [Burkholderia pseudomallei MSHR4032]|nr:hypothetical protein X880_6107 [Burkholderia pseudomallei MSHR4032]
MQKRTLALCLLAALNSSCATDGPAIKSAASCEPQIVVKTRVTDTACDWTKPIYVSKTDILSDDTARAILTHNLAGGKNCGWKPAGK